MACPSDMMKQQSSLDLLKSAFLFGNVFDMYGEFVFNSNVEMNFFSSGKYQKIKSVAFDNLNTAGMNSLHQGRREYLRHQLQNICFLSDQPVFIKRFDIVTAAICFARDELIWYLNHYENDFHGKRKHVRRDGRSGHDGSFAELLWLVLQLRRKIVDNRARMGFLLITCYLYRNHNPLRSSRKGSLFKSEGGGSKSLPE